MSLTLTPLNTFGMNSSPGLPTQHQCLISLMLLMNTNPISNTSEKPSQKSKAYYYYIKEGNCNIKFSGTILLNSCIEICYGTAGIKCPCQLNCFAKICRWNVYVVSTNHPQTSYTMQAFTRCSQTNDKGPSITLKCVER